MGVSGKQPHYLNRGVSFMKTETGSTDGLVYQSPIRILCLFLDPKSSGFLPIRDSSRLRPFAWDLAFEQAVGFWLCEPNARK